VKNSEFLVQPSFPCSGIYLWFKLTDMHSAENALNPYLMSDAGEHKTKKTQFYNVVDKLTKTGIFPESNAVTLFFPIFNH